MSVTRLLECLTLINCQLALPAIRNSQRFKLSGISFEGTKPLVRCVSLLLSFILFYLMGESERNAQKVREIDTEEKIRVMDHVFRKKKQNTNFLRDYFFFFFHFFNFSSIFQKIQLACLLFPSRKNRVAHFSYFEKSEV